MLLLLYMYTAKNIYVLGHGHVVSTEPPTCGAPCSPAAANLLCQAIDLLMTFGMSVVLSLCAERGVYLWDAKGQAAC
jgi:hypothetical protein